MFSSNAYELTKKFAETVNVASDKKYYSRLHNLDLRAEESIEWWLAWKNSDMIEMVDGLGDADFVNYMYLAITGKRKVFNTFNLMNTCKADLMALSSLQREAVLLEVCESNLSKFDTTEDQAKVTQETYLNKGIETFYEVAPSGLYVTKVAETVDVIQENGEIKCFPKFKTMKSAVNFRLPNFIDLI